MPETIGYLRELNMASLTLRLVLAMLFGGMLGMERGTKRRPAGFRTYMMVCIGATLAILLGEYEYEITATRWADTAELLGTKVDVTRFGAQVINGIGFLGAGTIIVTGHREVKGLTTAAGLWASACMGLAIGAGFYECVFLGFLLIFISAHLLPAVEDRAVERARNMNLYVEFRSLDDVGKIIGCIKSQDIRIYEVELERGHGETYGNPSAVFMVHLNQKQSHVRVIAALSELECVQLIDEI